VFDYDPRNLPPELLKAVGLAITSWVQTENVIKQVIAGMLRLTFIQGLAVTTEMSNHHLLNALSTLADLEFDEHEQDLLAPLVKRLRKGCTARNELSHDQWYRHPKTNELFLRRDSAKGSIKISSVPRTVAEIEMAAAEIYQVGM